MDKVSYTYFGESLRTSRSTLCRLDDVSLIIEFALVGCSMFCFSIEEWKTWSGVALSRCVCSSSTVYVFGSKFSLRPGIVSRFIIN